MDELRNGYILARVANEFSNGKLKKIHNGKKGNPLEFMMSSDNINNFFETCKNVNFPQIYFFSLSDLWENKNR
jgi:hypothetical protein